MLIRKGHLPERILPPARTDCPERSSFDYCRCTSMALNNLSTHTLPIDHEPGTAPPEDTLDEEPIDPHNPDFTSTPDPTYP
jgi:hypothetical protein